MAATSFYGISELAAAVSRPGNLIRQWHHRGKLPAPTAVLAMGPVWSGEAIENWIEQQNEETPPTAAS
jgi:hypothetical protein